MHFLFLFFVNIYSLSTTTPFANATRKEKKIIEKKNETTTKKMQAATQLLPAGWVKNKSKKKNNANSFNLSSVNFRKLVQIIEIKKIKTKIWKRQQICLLIF